MLICTKVFSLQFYNVATISYLIPFKSTSSIDLQNMATGQENDNCIGQKLLQCSMSKVFFFLKKAQKPVFVICFIYIFCRGGKRIGVYHAGKLENIKGLNNRLPCLFTNFTDKILPAFSYNIHSLLHLFVCVCVFRQQSELQQCLSQHTMKQLLTSLLDSRQWSSQSHNASVQPPFEWSSSGSPVYLSLTLFLLMKVQTMKTPIKESFISA